MGTFIDLSGKKFGRLTVIERCETRKRINKKGSGSVKWKCKCSCGNEVYVFSQSLRNGHTKSCGCLMREINAARFRTHGESNTKLNKVWRCMIQRTTNPNDKKYALYGARGIKVCNEWLKFENFSDWSKKNGYREGLTIDRIDSDKGYSPDNCRWATYTEQNNHLSRNRYIEIDGETKTLAQWARHYGIKYRTVSNRLHNLHWDAYRALTEPVRRKP